MFTFMGKKPAVRAYHHGNLRRAMLDASLEVISELGPEGFTLRDIARRLGVAPSAPYRHFADKEAVLVAVAAECGERLGAAMDAAAKLSDDPLDRFRNTGLAYVRFAVENPSHFKIMTHAKVGGLAPFRVGFEEWMQTEIVRLKEAQAQGQIANLPVEDIMLAARCLTYGLARLIVDAQDGLENISPETATRLAEKVTAVLGCGLSPRKEPA
jgi:AcrR family transcriptional regulator